MKQGIRAVAGAGLAWGLAVLPAAAQSVAVPASDPVGIARSGVQAAYGYSLEAASFNPALLASLKDPRQAYVSLGMELQSSQVSLQSDQQTWYSSDRNRDIPAFGLAYRVAPALTLGLKADTPFERHGAFAPDATNRFMGDRLDLSVRRMEAQAAWALAPGVSLGLGLGMVHARFDSATMLRANVPLDPSQPVSTTNPVTGLVEERVAQAATKLVPSYSLGLRWAINPRWTLGFVHQSGYSMDLALHASRSGTYSGIYANDGLSPALLGTAPLAAALVQSSHAVPGSGRLELPSQTTLGVRHRIHPRVTWEGDLRWTAGGLTVPSLPGLVTPSGTVNSPGTFAPTRSHLGLGLSADVELGKLWTARAGLFLDQNDRSLGEVEPLVGGARQAAFSVGVGYRIWGGEVNFGVQYRQSKDQDVTTLNGVWSDVGYRGTGTTTRVEGMGHLIAIGYRRSF